MGATVMRTFKLPSGESMPALGQGTWHMGENSRRRKEEIAALRLGLDLGLSLIDTAEMYGDGITEELVGEAIHGRREEVFLISKVLPQHASAKRCLKACDNSLLRLDTDYIDLYLLHWRGPTPLAETVEAMQTLKSRGKVRHWGVSNLDVADLEELVRLEGGRGVEVDQVLYNLSRRGVEYDLRDRVPRPACHLDKHRIGDELIKEVCLHDDGGPDLAPHQVAERPTDQDDVAPLH